MLLAIVLASTALPSCGGESNVQESGTTDTTQQTVETNALTGSGLEVRDWGGKTFNVMTSKPGSDGHSFRNFEVYATEENGDIVNDAVYRRNMTLETLLNVNITETPISTELTGDDIRQAVLAGDQMYDLAFARSYEIGKLALEGNLYDMNQPEYPRIGGTSWSSRTPKSKESCSSPRAHSIFTQKNAPICCFTTQI